MGRSKPFGVIAIAENLRGFFHRHAEGTAVGGRRASLWRGREEILFRSHGKGFCFLFLLKQTCGVAHSRFARVKRIECTQ